MKILIKFLVEFDERYGRKILVKQSHHPTRCEHRMWSHHLIRLPPSSNKVKPHQELRWKERENQVPTWPHLIGWWWATWKVVAPHLVVAPSKFFSHMDLYSSRLSFSYFTIQMAPNYDWIRPVYMISMKILPASLY